MIMSVEELLLLSDKASDPSQYYSHDSFHGRRLTNVPVNQTMDVILDSVTRNDCMTPQESIILETIIKEAAFKPS